MDMTNSRGVNGSLQISTDVIAKIARLAAMEIEGVKEVRTSSGVKGVLGKSRNVSVSLLDDIAEISLNIVVVYGSKVPAVCEKVQENVKAAVQNMTSITVSRVNLTVIGVQTPETEEE